MSSPTKRLLLAFAKYPQAGLVKTRLGKVIGHEQATQLYRAFLADLAPRYAARDDTISHDTRWVYIPANNRFPELIVKLQGEQPATDRTSFVAYEEPGLAQQQTDQLAWAHCHGYRHIVIVSTDTPHLPRSHIAAAFELLEKCDIVVGPTNDGGYYLLGTQPHHPILATVAMSTNHVAKDIMDVTDSLKLAVRLLPSMLDVDEEQDLATLVQLINQADQNPCPATWAILQALHLR